MNDKNMSLEDEIGFKLFQVQKGIKQLRNEDFMRFDITGEQARLLGYICCNDKGEPIVQVDIEKKFNLSNPTVTGLLQRLESKGFIERIPSEKDRRCKIIRPTDKSRDLMEEAVERRRLMDEQMVNGFSDKDKARLMEYLDRIINNLRRKNSD